MPRRLVRLTPLHDARLRRFCAAKRDMRSMCARRRLSARLRRSCELNTPSGSTSRSKRASSPPRAAAVAAARSGVRAHRSTAAIRAIRTRSSGEQAATAQLRGTTRSSRRQLLPCHALDRYQAPLRGLATRDGGARLPRLTTPARRSGVPLSATSNRRLIPLYDNGAKRSCWTVQNDLEPARLHTDSTFARSAGTPRICCPVAGSEDREPGSPEAKSV